MTPKRVLALGAHPDDVELGCGAAVARLAATGAAVTIVCATAGEQGTDDAAAKLALARTRRAEAVAGAAELGVKDVRFLGLPDGLTGFSLDDKIAVVRVLREVRPDCLFLHAKADTFPDHGVVHRLAMAAVVAAAGPWYPDAGGEPHRTGLVLGYEVWHPIAEPTLILPCGAGFAAKLRALQKHASQLAAVDYLGAAEGLGRYRGALSGAGGPAEAFEILHCAPHAVSLP